MCYNVDIHIVKVSVENNHNNHNNKLSVPSVPLFASPVDEWTLAGNPWLHTPLEPRSGGRLRRLRAALRHEQQSIAMALASALHHSADKTTRAQYNAPRGQKNAGTEYYVLSDEEDVVPAWGSRPPCLGEPRGPQERDQLRTVEQIAVYAPMVQILDVPVAQMGEQLVDVLHFFDALIPVAEQAIEVPKIIIERIPPRTSVREPQLAEQLVEVPTIVSFSSLQRVMEQTVDIPVPQGGGRHADLQSFFRGQSAT